MQQDRVISWRGGLGVRSYTLLVNIFIIVFFDPSLPCEISEGISTLLKNPFILQELSRLSIP